MAGGSVHDAAALIERDIVGENSGDLDRHEGVLELHAFKVTAFVSGENFRLLDFTLGLKRGSAIASEKQLAFYGLHHRVFVTGLKSQSPAVGNAPGRRRPYDC